MNSKILAKLEDVLDDFLEEIKPYNQYTNLPINMAKAAAAVYEAHEDGLKFSKRQEKK